MPVREVVEAEFDRRRRNVRQREHDVAAHARTESVKSEIGQWQVAWRRSSVGHAGRVPPRDSSEVGAVDDDVDVVGEPRDPIRRRNARIAHVLQRQHVLDRHVDDEKRRSAVGSKFRVAIDERRRMNVDLDAAVTSRAIDAHGASGDRHRDDARRSRGAWLRLGRRRDGDDSRDGGVLGDRRVEGEIVGAHGIAAGRWNDDAPDERATDVDADQRRYDDIARSTAADEQ